MFAVLFAGLEKLGSTRNPFGEWGSLAHSQTKQRWALWTGRRGPHAVTFVLTFVGAGVGFAWSTQSIAAGAVAVVAAVVVGLSTVRAKQSETDRASSAVAGLVEQDSSFFALFLPKFLAAKTESDEYWSNFCRATKHSLIDLARRTEQVAEDGADLVVWAEGAGFLCSSQYEWALQRIIESTKKAGCVVVATWLLLDRNERTFTNTATVILPNREIATVYAKAHPVPGIEAERTKMSPSVVEAVETKFGRLAVIICFDADHPDSWSQLHDADIDVVAIPASDWTAIGALHADMARLRARSVGAALIRPARNGHSTVVDKNGRMLSTVDHTVSREPDLVAVL